MRYQLATLVLALSITSASTQSITDIPTCAYLPAINSINTSSCNLSNLSCICKSTGWLNALLPEVSKACSPADLEKTRTITVALCKNLGVDLVLPSGTTGTIPSPTATSATKSVASAAATSVVSSRSSNATAAIASATPTGSATSFSSQSGLMGMIGIAMGMMVM